MSGMLFLNPLLLYGLVAVAIPPAVHFLTRRRYDEVDWGAMQFLQLSPKSRRKILLEQWLLITIRMAVLGLLAVALAGPVVRSTVFARPEDRRPRTTVILIDASASMGLRHEGRTGSDAAKAWAAGFLSELRRGDRVAVFAVKGDVVPLIGTPTGEAAQARSALELMPQPRGTADWPAAIETAIRLLDSTEGDPEIVILSDAQRFGWADGGTL